MIRVLICDDQEVVREGLRAILGTVPDFEVVAVATDGDEALERIPQTRPDVVLMDLKMPHLNGVQATRLITERYSGVRVLVLTTYDADEWVFDAIRSGAAGYLLKDTPRERLVEAIQRVARGETPVDSKVAGKLFQEVTRHPRQDSSALTDLLNERETEILRLLALGLSNADIAGRLYLSEGTVRNYVSSILEKLHVSARTQAAILALRYGLVDIGEDE
ncbi:MAG: response regulator transcription factor [Anaerolineales bacterium]